MGFSYLGYNSENGRYSTWIELTREERLFCSHLYHDIRSGHLERDFVRWLKASDIWWNEKARTDLVIEQNWEVAYEVCFYRDLLNSVGRSVDNTEYSNKRTFDLCLFSERTIVIIEAKVHEIFGGKQIKSFKKDRRYVNGLLAKEDGVGPEVVIVALASSVYFANVNRPEHPTGQGLRDVFDGRITWQQVQQFLGPVSDGLYGQADAKYPRRSMQKET